MKERIEVLRKRIVYLDHKIQSKDTKAGLLELAKKYALIELNKLENFKN